MSLSALPRRSAYSASTAPIKGYNRRGFVIGWVAIIALAVAGYAFASSHLSPSSAQLHLANIAGHTYPVFARS
ncbi:hypothetical protein NO932_13190 [Pelagibacterium sp. 26DY04]|uniref:hypothetical protein n=1 Tax=unclassified Pelagibacterium TaxID=2623280 RepID=UPI00281603C8|nr:MULTISPECIES: hypothetical protein [unclassified Pelagibacterium]WMT85876.1 hypothetical protein NO932_13190 [Pelagibacterium sp. 26DY04]WMT89842.1 hypothetical protein NO934_13705 [Pelagibacterium sp. H642]